MNAIEVPTKKRCPKCKEVDVTTFSKCRNCGTRYDAVPQQQHKPIDLTLPLVLCLAFVFIGYFVYQYSGMINTAAKKSTAMKASPCPARVSRSLARGAPRQSASIVAGGMAASSGALGILVAPRYS